VLAVHRVELEVLASNNRAINCYLACGFRQEGVRREAELYPDGRVPEAPHRPFSPRYFRVHPIPGLFCTRARTEHGRPDQ
jgi:RimJ/RimL family protein N-acetyltransferase